MTKYVPFTDRFGRKLPKLRPVPEPSWEERFDACMKRLREIDAEEARLHREFIADMHGLLADLDPPQVLREAGQ